MKKISLSVTLISLLILALFFQLSNANAIQNQIDRNVAAMMDNIEQMAVKNPQLAASSNPYDYISGNENYNNIVKLGPKALPIIEEKVKSSKENGLREYILAMAAEEIAKVDLKGDNFGWSNAKEWANKWDRHLEEVKGKVEKIVTSTNNAKVKELVKLGTPAIPFIMDKIEEGNVELTPALEELLDGKDLVGFKKNTTAEDYISWVKANKGRFDDLRQLVERTQTQE